MAGWFVPGLGHVLIGETRRGLILGACILSLWIGGLLIGGPGVIDWHSTTAPIVRKGQYGLFVTLGFEWLRNRYLVEISPRQTVSAGSGRIGYRPSYNRVEEQGVLFVALAGLLNIIVIIDLIHRSGDLEEPIADRSFASPETESNTSPGASI